MSSARNLEKLDGIANRARGSGRDTGLPPTQRLAPTQDISEVCFFITLYRSLLTATGPRNLRLRIGEDAGDQIDRQVKPIVHDLQAD
jgi:hypothetical protein